MNEVQKEILRLRSVIRDMARAADEAAKLEHEIKELKKTINLVKERLITIDNYRITKHQQSHMIKNTIKIINEV